MSFGKKNSLRSYQRLRLPAHQHRLLRIEALENRLLLSATTHNPPEVSALRNIGGVPSHVIAKHEGQTKVSGTV